MLEEKKDKSIVTVVKEEAWVNGKKFMLGETIKGLPAKDKKILINCGHVKAGEIDAKELEKQA